MPRRMICIRKSASLRYAPQLIMLLEKPQPQKTLNSVWWRKNLSGWQPAPASRVRAFFLTDRVGQTLATTLGMASVVRWWTGKQIRQRRRTTR